MIETILGGLLGGAVRMAPEVMSIWDRRNERKHELEMARFSLDADIAKAKMQLVQTHAEGEYKIDLAAVDALAKSIEAQGKPSGIPIIDALSSSVRPVLTYWWCLGLYTAALAAEFILLNQSNSAVESIVALWGPDEKAIVSSMLTFWFVGRVLDRQRRG